MCPSSRPDPGAVLFLAAMLIVCGALVNGPYALITTAVSADLVSHGIFAFLAVFPNASNSRQGRAGLLCCVFFFPISSSPPLPHDSTPVPLHIRQAQTQWKYLLVNHLGVLQPCSCQEAAFSHPVQCWKLPA